MRNHTRASLERARTLRREMTLPELLVWRELRRRPAGLKFRRQHPIGDSVAVFYCDEAALVVEIDGEAHDMGDRPRRDQQRDDWMRGQGLRVFRIPAREVFADLGAVIEGIVAHAVPLRRASRATSPDGGGVALCALLVSILLATPAFAQAPGTGWSRASDLQVYGAFDMTRDLVREQQVLCSGRNPASVAARWNRRFGAREAAVAAAMAREHGAAALALAEARAGDRPSCDNDERRRFRRAHVKLLKTLELRVAGYGSRD